MRPIEDMSRVRLRASPDAVRRFQEMRFSLFVHWGVYSLIGHGEWVMHTEQIPIPEYEKLPPRFNPVNFNADAWADLMMESGQRYIVITSKHHDGFCMFDSVLTDYKITNTPFKRDPIAELAEACRQRGLVLGFYYSLLDWHHPAYRADWPAYVAYYQSQVRELCTQYGDIGMIWFDGYWPAHDPPAPHFLEGGPWDLAGTYDLIHSLQPQALIGNNHHVTPLPGEDFQMFEQDLPGENTAGFNAPSIGDRVLESCLTINRNWGYNPNDHEHKSATELIRFLTQCLGRDSNLLLNVGPTPLGEIQPEHVERLRGLGAWLTVHGESVYGTRPGPVGPQAWGYVTQNAATGRVYLHVLEWPRQELAVELSEARTAWLLKDGTRLPLRRDGTRVVLSLPEQALDATDTVIVVEGSPAAEAAG